MNLYQWAIKWAVPLDAIKDLEQQIGHDGPGSMPERHKGTSEAAAQAAVRLEAANKGVRLWRNNVGALLDENGRMVRYGLANDSKGVNEVLKSGDLIGIRRRSVAELFYAGVPYVGQFVSREMKEPGWTYSGTDREVAQQNWSLLIAANGGDAGFATGEGTL